MTFDINDRIQAFRLEWMSRRGAEGVTDEMFRKHFGDLREPMKPEDVEAAVKAICKAEHRTYCPPETACNQFGCVARIARDLLTRYAVSQPTVDKSDPVDWKGKYEAGVEREKKLCRDIDAALDRAQGLDIAVAGYAEKLDTALARVKELEAKQGGGDFRPLERLAMTFALEAGMQIISDALAQQEASR